MVRYSLWIFYIAGRIPYPLNLVNRHPFMHFQLPSAAPAVNKAIIYNSEHFVLFYDSEQYLTQSIEEVFVPGLSTGCGAIIICTLEHQAHIKECLAARGIDVARAIDKKQLVLLDAQEVLNKFTENGFPSKALFMEQVGSLVKNMASTHPRLIAFGEMVALLWEQGKKSQAIALENLWNDLGKEVTFSLFCAYPSSGFTDKDMEQFSEVCSCHRYAIPTETYTSLASSEDRLKAICELEQRARSLGLVLEQKESALNALQRKERELREFLENAAECLHRVGPDGRILWANNKEMDLLGYPIEEYIGKNIREIHADARVIEDILSKLKRGDILQNYPARLRCKDGSIKIVRINSNVAWDEQGNFKYTQCFSRDVTDEIKWEKLFTELTKNLQVALLHENAEEVRLGVQEALRSNA
jgi:PAS domain S-box-containing protein